MFTAQLKHYCWCGMSTKTIPAIIISIGILGSCNLSLSKYFPSILFSNCLLPLGSVLPEGQNHIFIIFMSPAPSTGPSRLGVKWAFVVNEWMNERITLWIFYLRWDFLKWPAGVTSTVSELNGTTFSLQRMTKVKMMVTSTNLGAKSSLVLKVQTNQRFWISILVPMMNRTSLLHRRTHSEMSVSGAGVCQGCGWHQIRACHTALWLRPFLRLFCGTEKVSSIIGSGGLFLLQPPAVCILHSAQNTIGTP